MSKERWLSTKRQRGNYRKRSLIAKEDCGMFKFVMEKLFPKNLTPLMNEDKLTNKTDKQKYYLPLTIQDYLFSQPQSSLQLLRNLNAGKLQALMAHHPR